MFKEERYINRDDILKERTTDDFCHWVENNLKEWASKRKTDPDGEKLNDCIILGKGLFTISIEKFYLSVDICK
jgi:hypothetical protein